MVKITQLLEGYKEFYNNYFIKQPDFYEQLVREGQSPKTLVISCSDSRVDPSILLNTKPGDIFVIRNIANLVPKFDCDISHCHGTSAAIEYAVKYLKVENIIVLGHSHCGGIHSLVDSQQKNTIFINTWLDIAKTTKIEEICNNYSAEEACVLCEKEAIRISVNNLLSFPFIKEAVDNKLLELHGWYFELKSGIIEIV